ncbi:hypothetical protein C7S13_8635 [Burkholderia cepacia]|nr:hypothetical protein [Burkholderia cepacia]
MRVRDGVLACCCDSLNTRVVEGLDHTVEIVVRRDDEYAFAATADNLKIN